MSNIPSLRLAKPKAAPWELVRKDQVDIAVNSTTKLVYIQAGAGYGKTTLLSQIASLLNKNVWLTLDGENDIYSFIELLCEGIRRNFQNYDFNISEFMLYTDRSNHIKTLANALICSIEKIKEGFAIIIDDLHTVQNSDIRRLILSIIKYKPDNIMIYLSSREAPWDDLVPFKLKGSMLEITQRELAFSVNEIKQILGFENENIYTLTEGWPLVIGSLKVLLDSGASLKDLLKLGNDTLYTYLFNECINRLCPETVSFIRATGSFQELDVQMLDSILGIQNSKDLLETLCFKNIFTKKTDIGLYRYHPLFREYLLQSTDNSYTLSLFNKAAKFYYTGKQYSKAAKYAILSENNDLLINIILTSYRELLKTGNFSELLTWFNALAGKPISISCEFLTAKAAFLSSIGNFSEANKCLDSLIPQLNTEDKELYIEVMVHKARVLRNFVSLEESNRLIDNILMDVSGQSPEAVYTVVIEKAFNLCLNSQVNEALKTLLSMVENCAKEGDLKVKAWYERYLTAVYFYAGRMKETVYYYEKSLGLPDNERQFLGLHNIGIYAAKAYQMLGDRSRSLSILSSELQKLRSNGRYEEMWMAYLLAAEIHYQNTFIDNMNGSNNTFDAAIKYFTLADEYAPLYRKTEFQINWARMLKLVSSLMFKAGPKDEIIQEISSNLENVTDYLKTVVLGRLFGYYGAIADFQNSIKSAKLAIEIGEKSGIMLIPTLAYGILAIAALSMNNFEDAFCLTRRYLQLCSDNGVYEYFKIHKTYGRLLQFAVTNDIEPEFAQQMIDFSGTKPKKVYIQTFGGFFVFPYKDRQKSLKMRSKKERELLAFIMNSGKNGVSKEQIYNAIFSESDSDNIKKLIGVNLSYIKKHLSDLGIENAVINNDKFYSICMDEIELDANLLEKAIEEFKQQKSKTSAQRILSLYKGEFLSEFEALWATAKRIKYSEAYEEALSVINGTL